MSKKIIEVYNSSHPAFRFLKYYSEKLSLGWVFEQAPNWDDAMKAEADLALVDLQKSLFLLENLSLVPAQVKTFGCFDSLVMESGRPIPRNIFYDSLEKFFIEHARDLDIRAAAFVVGDDVEARVVSLFLASRGIRNIYLVGNISKLVHELKILKRAQIGINFSMVAPEEMTLQTVVAGVLVNTMNLSGQEELVTDLSYFNYMKSDAYILDLYPVQKENALLEEAERAGLRILSEHWFLETFVKDCLTRLGVEYQSSVWDDFVKENYS